MFKMKTPKKIDIAENCSCASASTPSVLITEHHAGVSQIISMTFILLLLAVPVCGYGANMLCAGLELPRASSGGQQIINQDTNEKLQGLGTWTESRYADFADGTFGNGGQNIYVSKAGVLQRIHYFDFNKDGYMDLLFVNSQDFNERPPVEVFSDVFGKAVSITLPTQGAYSGAIGDLNGDGYADLVIANQCNGTHSDVVAYIYYGSPEGLSERYKLELPAPNSRAVAIGDFNGDGKSDLAFSSDGKLRIFYQQADTFIPKIYEDINVEATHMASADLDGDGHADLYIRLAKGQPRILWGGPDGIDANKFLLVGEKDRVSENLPSSTPAWMPFVEGWVPKILQLNHTPYLFRAEGDEACLYPVQSGRMLGTPIRLKCENAVSAGVGDFNKDGMTDLVIATCKDRSKAEKSWIYWGTKEGFVETNKTPLETISARDIAVSDLDGDGYDDIAICQGRTDIMNTTESLVFRGSAKGIVSEPARFATHDATTVLAGKTSDDKNPQVIFIDHLTGRVRGDVSAYAYLGGPDGFSAERRYELPDWSAPDGACCDFNDSGWPDILLSNCAENAPHLDPGSFLYWGDADGFDAERKLVLPTFRAHGSAVGDFRHSGYLDIAMVGFSNPEMLIFRQGPEGYDLKNPQRLLLDPKLSGYTASRESFGGKSEFSEPRWLYTADFNNDGWLDIFVSQITGPHCLILWGGPEGFNMDRITLLAADGTACAHAADLDGDGWLDLVIGGHQSLGKNWKYDSYIYVYWGGPKGFQETRRTQLPAHACNSLAIADFNNDGILDIFTSSYNDGRERDCDNYIYWGMPGGVYSAENRTILYGHSVSGCTAGDFNEDGWIDLAMANHKVNGSHVGYSQIWWNGPDGFSQNKTTKLPTNGPHGMIALDPGNIMDRKPEEYYISSEYKLPNGSKVTTVSWEAEIQPKTWVKCQIRTSATKEGLSEATWQGPNGSDSWFDNGDKIDNLSMAGAWIQYRLALGAVNGGNTPRVKSVSIHYATGK